MIVFVDDSGISVDLQGDNLEEKLRHSPQQHEHYLHITGGKITLQKLNVG